MIEVLKDETAPQWDAYVGAHPDGTVFHLSAWRHVLRDLGFDTYYLTACGTDGAITGVLPLAHVKSFLFGNHLVSLPYCVYAGPIADDQDCLKALVARATELAEELQVSDVEFRAQASLACDLPQKDLYATFRRELPEGEDAMMAAIPRKQRAMVRKGIKAGLESAVTRDLTDFYPIYAESVRNLGTPVFAKRYFESLLRHFEDAADILMVRAPSGEFIAGVLSLYYKNEVLPYYGGSLFAARALKGNDFMYWELMRHAAARGITSFDFGRSKVGTGPYSFKKNWGFEPIPLPYQYLLMRGDDIPQVNPTNPKFALMISVWKRLPLPVANFLGPLVSKNLG